MRLTVLGAETARVCMYMHVYVVLCVCACVHLCAWRWLRLCYVITSFSFKKKIVSCIASGLVVFSLWMHL